MLPSSPTLSSTIAIAIAALGTIQVTVAQDAATQPYQHGPDSEMHQGVPQGTVTEHQLLSSKVFPGTKRRYYVYVPAQYSDKTPAALMVVQDGHAYKNRTGDFRLPTVFDNLIAKGQIPVTIAIMIDPGHLNRDLPEKPGWRPRPANRAHEYDTLSDDYVRMVLEEILPKIQKEYSITKNPNLRATCGSSSGGICAFTMAWERPDAFRRVLSHIGSFVSIREGHTYPARIRKTEKKPLRVLLQDGENDLDNVHGNWPLANRQMAAALKFKGYDYKLVFGNGGHNGNHAGAIFPDSLRWLWQDWEKETP
ncbi:MAG: alpha/beta hydrolase-fold protein [Planctomycetota bacterium]